MTHEKGGNISLLPVKRYSIKFMKKNKQKNLFINNREIIYLNDTISIDGFLFEKEDLAIKISYEKNFSFNIYLISKDTGEEVGACIFPSVPSKYLSHRLACSLADKLGRIPVVVKGHH